MDFGHGSPEATPGDLTVEAGLAVSLFQSSRAQRDMIESPPL
jgi:hypothetical protein